MRDYAKVGGKEGKPAFRTPSSLIYRKNRARRKERLFAKAKDVWKIWPTKDRRLA